MAASGLQELLELIYASNGVVHMLTGKAIARAVRAHLIVDASLYALLLANILNVPLSGNLDEAGSEEEGTEATMHEETVRNPDLEEAAVLYKHLMQGSMSADQVCQADVLTRIKNALQKGTKSLQSSRTAALWLQYMNMVEILRKYIRAERTGKGLNCMSKLFQKCSLTWKHRGITIIQNLHGYICNRCPVFKINIQMSINNFKTVYMW